MNRYNRNILMIEESGQQKLLNSKILIAGAGGLGSTVIVNLASLGIGKLGIIDNDKLDITNLNRQYIHKFENIGKDKVDSAEEWIKSFNPDIEVEKFKLRLNEDNAESIISKFDLVIDCFDSYASKFILNDICNKLKKPLIHGGVMEYSGQVLTIFPEKSACLRCIFPDANLDAYVVKGIISPTVSVIASLQAMEAAKVILGEDNLLIDKLLTYNGKLQEFKKINLTKNQACPLCSTLKV
ncbi:MAG: HesA/MoeB/ThiF family protein [bacterium]